MLTNLPVPYDLEGALSVIVKTDGLFAAILEILTHYYLVSLGRVSAVSWFRCVEDLILLGLFLVARSGPSVVTAAGLAVVPSLTASWARACSGPRTVKWSNCSPCCCCSPVTSLTGSTTWG